MEAPVYILNVRQINKQSNFNNFSSRWFFKSKNEVKISLKTNFIKNTQLFAIFNFEVSFKFHIFFLVH